MTSISLPQNNRVDQSVSLSSDNLDYFGALPVSTRFTQLNFKNELDFGPGYINTLTFSGGTSVYNTVDRTLDASVTTTVGSRVLRFTKRAFIYQPGKAILLEMTGVPLTSLVGGVRSAFGMGSISGGEVVEGFWLEYWDGWRVVRRTSITGSPVDTVVEQANWNGDKADGSGLSGLNLDPTKGNILQIEAQYLGVGNVEISVIIDRKKVVLHKFFHVNDVTSKYTRTGDFHPFYEVEQMDGISAGTQKQICLQMSSSGGFEPIGLTLSVQTPTDTLVSTSEVGILAVRMKIGSASLNLIDFGAISDSNTEFSAGVHVASSVTGGSWSDVPGGHCEVNTTFTDFTSIRLATSAMTSDRVRSSSGVTSNTLITGVNSDDTYEIIVLSARALSVNANVWGWMNIQELY